MQQPIFTGLWGAHHIQGIAVDEQNGYIYYSFTTKLVKATLAGEVVGTVEGLVGHLGCIAFCKQDGCLYGSLEYKHDSIGQNILKKSGTDIAVEDGFYVVRFDVSKIDRIGLTADNGNVMTAVHLKEVLDDYHGQGIGNVPHKYGCSGIDGITFAALPGKSEQDGIFLYVAYGVYGDNAREDNDYQVLLCYDTKDWDAFAKPLDQHHMHTCGPQKPFDKFFVYTGNTCFGVQNLEYDRFTNAMIMAVYKGKKPNFPNFSLFAVDMEKAPKRVRHSATGEEIKLLSLKECGQYDAASNTYGWFFPWGTTGLYSYGDGRWLISHQQHLPEGNCAHIYSYIWDETNPFLTVDNEKGE